MTVSHQTVRLTRGRHATRQAGVCVMELASMLADEPFSDRPSSVSPTIGAFLRTYNDGLDDERRQDLYSIAAAIVGSARRRAVERERINRCLEFALSHHGRTPASRASLALATPEPAGAWAAMAALGAGAPVAMAPPRAAGPRARAQSLSVASAGAPGRREAVDVTRLVASGQRHRPGG